MTWTEVTINKCFDDGNNGHFFLLANRFIVFAWHYPRLKGKYGRRGFKQ